MVLNHSLITLSVEKWSTLFFVSQKFSQRPTIKSLSVDCFPTDKVWPFSFQVKDGSFHQARGRHRSRLLKDFRIFISTRRCEWITRDFPFDVPTLLLRAWSKPLEVPFDAKTVLFSDSLSWWSNPHQENFLCDASLFFSTAFSIRTTQGCKKSVPLVSAVQGRKVIWGEEVSLFYIFLQISEGKFAIHSCCGTGKQNIFCSPENQ